MEIPYTLVGNYYRPNLAAPESPKAGRWGMLRFNYLRKHWEALYTINTYNNRFFMFSPSYRAISRIAVTLIATSSAAIAANRPITRFVLTGRLPTSLPVWPFMAKRKSFPSHLVFRIQTGSSA